MLTPIILRSLLFIACCGCCYYMIKRRTIVRWIYSVWFGVLGLTGCVITFLVLISSHEATDPNVLILWLNPLQFVLAVTVWSSRLKIVSYIVSYYNIIALTCLLIVWPVQAQSANPAFFPLMGITLMLAIMLAYNGPHVYGVNKNAYKSLNKSGGKSTATSSRKAGRGINKKQISRK